jgi:hypothetical protein
LERRSGRDRGKAARDVFTYNHWFLASGAILYAVAARQLVHQPAAPLPASGRFSLAAGLLFVTFSIAASRYRLIHRLANARSPRSAQPRCWLSADRSAPTSHSRRRC